MVRVNVSLILLLRSKISNEASDARLPSVLLVILISFAYEDPLQLLGGLFARGHYGEIVGRIVAMGFVRLVRIGTIL